MDVVKYQIEKLQSIKFVNKIIKDVKSLDEVFNVTIDRTTKIMVLELNIDSKNNQLMHKLEDKITKLLRKYSRNVKIVRIDNKITYRRVLYLNGLDCAYCATRIENLVKKEFSHERIVVDYPTYRFIIETTDKDLIDNIESRVTSIAHKVDERIVVTSGTNEKKLHKQIEDSIKKPTMVVIWIGIIIFIIGCIIAYTFEEILSGKGRTDSIFGVILVVIGYLMIGHRIIWRFLKNLVRGHIFDENFLMTIASIGALATEHFVEAAMVMLIYQFGEFLQRSAVNRTRKSIAELLTYDVQSVKLRVGNDITEISPEGVLPDDVIVVAAGEMIPLDGRICKGRTLLDTKNITGESLSREVGPGDEILSGSLNIGSVIEIRVTHTYNNSMMTRILDLVENATINKAKAENFITKFAKYYTPVVVVIAALIAIAGSITSIFVDGVEWTHWIYVAMEFLVISCPCALVISVPLCFFCAIGVASKRGILIKGSNYLEAMYHIENMVFDKTGTLTKGNFSIVDIFACDKYSKQDIERYFVYCEYYSKHPIGKSIVDNYGRENIFTEIISEFQVLQGGAKAVINGSSIMCCNGTLAKKEKLIFDEIDSPQLVIYVFKERTFIGYVVIGDQIRDEAFDTMNSLRKHGVENIYMLTGDTKSIAENVANKLQINDVYYELLPDQKVDKMEDIKNDIKHKNGTTAYVGDGINDAPVIATSDVGIAMGDTASDATISIADIVIMTNDLNKLTELLVIAKKTRAKVVENIIFALVVKVIVMILALGFSGIFTLPLWFAIFADVGVSLLAILNSITLMGLYKNKSKKEKSNE